MLCSQRLQDGISHRSVSGTAQPPIHAMLCSQRLQDSISHWTVSGTAQPPIRALRHSFEAGVLCTDLDKPGLEHSSEPILADGMCSWLLHSGPLAPFSWPFHLLHIHAKDLQSE